MNRRSIALIGFGALSHIFLEVFEAHLADHYRLAGIYSVPTPADGEGYPLFDSLEQLLAARPDYVLEFAGVEALRSHGEAVLAAGCDLIAVSIGALADDAFFARLRDTAAAHGSRLHLPNGAIGGFDVLRTMSLAGTEQVVIENYKAPAGLNGAPYLKGRALAEDREELVFRGTAREAIASFPKNVNVAVAAALAAADVDRAQVEITSVPGLRQNTHIVRAKNALAEVRLEISSLPDPKNPKSSTITAWSVAALLKELAAPVRFF
ncbi:MAG: aspartate dehydrogenase [Clostridia bacterium]|nr:aspartate dehydrogenase [Clostridia bacterium]